ncbi:HNH endonuclease [Streptomyces sp. MW-W600-10]|uniref:HNH endonuclease n=1 Tax=Streptomyces sp. MW-W600-10 TaxID=2829819 RepID=UPI001C48DE0B|nr:HNH endonuclease signature motif containing protein [Streptomyces sp. MW-W600-10]MBV7246384.1 HNH endonuclease [Streptomyces sp. MW-W600-10]
MTVVDESVQRGKRAKQPTWVWLMALTANNGLCAYCTLSPSTTLDHEAPIADNGADVWWNFLPACKPCNNWKGKRTAVRWLIDQKLHRERPTLRFDTRRMPLRMFHGFEERVSRTLREIGEASRRDWFHHHYGKVSHKNKAEMLQHLRTCRDELSGYPHLPWTTPNVCPSVTNMCTRHMCCGDWHPQARSFDAVILSDDQYSAFSKAAFREGMSEGDLAAKLIAAFLLFGNDTGASGVRRSGATVPTQRR